MEVTTGITAVFVFWFSIFLYWKIMGYYSKKEVGEKMYKKWNARLYFWQGAVFASTGVTFLIMYLLKWTNVLTF